MNFLKNLDFRIFGRNFLKSVFNRKYKTKIRVRGYGVAEIRSSDLVKSPNFKRQLEGFKRIEEQN